MSNLLNLDELNAQSASNKVSISSTGKILIGITGGFALGLTVICAPFVSPALRKFCLPYIPATDKQIANVLSAIKLKPAGKLIDLGSGDGRIVFEAAKTHNYISHGVELNPWLVLYSKLDGTRRGLGGKTKFFNRDLWKFNISDYDRVVIFGVQQMMADLEAKILKECKSDCEIVACRFPLPNMQPVKTIGEGIDTVWLYKMPQRTS